MRHLRVQISLLLCLSAAPARAGIHNMQSILATEAEEGVSGQVSASLDYKSGNVNYLFMNAAPVARYRHGDHLWIALASFDRRTNGDNLIVSGTFEHLRYRYALTDRVLAEAFTQHTYDEIRRLRLRALVGGGLKFDVIDEKRYGVDLGISYMLEHERNKNDGLSDGNASYLAQRSSSYLMAHYEVDERVQIVNTTYYQPKILAPRDTRVLTESSLSFQITGRLAFNTTFSLAYDSRPPETVKKIDTGFRSSVTFEL